jgi:hypothetical protein
MQIPLSLDHLLTIWQQYGIDGDFLTEVHMLQGKHAKAQKWHYIKEQEPDEVLFIQFFDSHAEKEGRPVGAPHGSPEMIFDEEVEELRESIECRVVALVSSTPHHEVYLLTAWSSGKSVMMPDQQRKV